MPTIIDAEIKEYLWTATDKTKNWELNVNKMLAAVRKKLKVDAVYVKERSLSVDGYTYTYFSSDILDDNLTGKTFVLTDSQIVTFLETCEEEGVFKEDSYHMEEIGVASAICYGIKMDEDVLGVVGIADVKNADRVWDEETKEAFLLLGRIVENIVDASYTKRVLAEQRRQKEFLEETLAQVEQANIAKRLFLNNMSHDIRTPMNAILGYATLAETHIRERQRVKDYLEKITASSRHLLSIISNILDMSRMENGKVSLEERPSSLNSIVFELKKMLIDSVKTKQQDLFIDTVDVQHDKVICDHARLKQLLLNIMSNSVKYTQVGGTISMRVVEMLGAPAGWANFEFRIKDNGIGMSEDFVKKVFAPFEREENSGVNKVIGTGLGMAITKNIVDLMKGDISVTSTKGVGSEFVVRLSFKISGEEPERMPVGNAQSVWSLPPDYDLESELHDVYANKKPVEETAEDDGGYVDVDEESDNSIDASLLVEDFIGKRILLAEDNEMNQEIAIAILEEAGFFVELATDGKEAVKKVAANKAGYYDIILMDIQMPNMNGYEAAKAIRAMDDREVADVPIIAMTADAFAEDRLAAFAAGMNEHIPKPIDITILFNVLKEILKV